MIEAEQPNPIWWSWQTVLDNANRLGVPNFQRGAVWETSNRVALMDSLFDASPCGSFVFWEPEHNPGDDPSANGVLLQRNSDQATNPLWIVDGQQRIRAMLEIFNQLLSPHIEPDRAPFVRKEDLEELRNIGHIQIVETSNHDFSDDGDASEENGGEEDEDLSIEKRLWLVVLPAMKVFDAGGNSLFKESSKSRLIQRSPVFRQFRPRAQRKDKGTKQILPIPCGTIPLASLLSSKGVFNDPSLRGAAVEALNVRDVKTLDALLPWGPQFVTGHAYLSESGNTPPTPLTWEAVLQADKGDKYSPYIGHLSKLLTDWQHVFSRFPKMLTESRFAVGWLPKCDVGSAIDVYVRINRSGIRVRPEEHALALLSRARSELVKDLAKFITRDGSEEWPKEMLDEREFLTHASDRQMGFSIWMALITRYTALFLFGTDARNWLLTNAIDKKVFRDSFDKIKSAEEKAKVLWSNKTFTSPNCPVEEAKERVNAALILVDDIFSVELFFDHRMARTKFLSLQPLLDMFSRVPAGEIKKLGERSGFREAFAKVMLWTMLYPNFTPDNLKSLIHGIHDIKKSNDNAKIEPKALPDWEPVEDEVRNTLQRYLNLLIAFEWTNKSTYTFDSEETAFNQLALDSFKEEVKEVKSLQSQAVGWLYAIERKNSAREFSWQAQFEGHDKQTGIFRTDKNRSYEEMPLRRQTEGDREGGLYPERQHIVPFVRAKAFVEKQSEANSIGNLTWLSSRQNGLAGLTYRWMVIDRGREGDNLNARGFLAPTNLGVPFAEVYNMIVDLHRASNFDKERAKVLYKSMCKGRIAWMVEQMRDWLNTDLSPEAKRWLE